MIELGCETQHLVASTKPVRDSTVSKHQVFTSDTSGEPSQLLVRCLVTTNRLKLDFNCKYLVLDWRPFAIHRVYTQDFMLCEKWIVHIDIWYIIRMKKPGSCLVISNANPHVTYGNLRKTRQPSRNPVFKKAQFCQERLWMKSTYLLWTSTFT